MMRFAFVLLTFLTAWPAAAQLRQAGRLELPTNPADNETYTALPLAERGTLITHHVINDYGRQPHTYHFIRTDTTLTALWRLDYKLPEKLVPYLTFTNEQYLFHLYIEPNTNRIAVFRLSLEEGMGDLYNGELPSALDISQFRVMGNVAYLAGYYRSRPVVMSFSFFDHSFRVFQGLYVNHMELGNVEVDPYRQEVHVSTYSARKRCQFTVRSYSPDGKPLRIIEYDGTQHSLITGKILPISAEESLLVGNYSADCTPYSQGIYVTRIQHTETGKLQVRTEHGEHIRYFDFSKLKNFFNYLKPKRQQRLLAQVLKRREAGKDYKFHYRLLIHDLIPTPTGLRVAAEVYFPLYKGSSSPFMNAPARNAFLSSAGFNPLLLPTTTSRQPTDRYSASYQFTHAFICEFDNAGNLIWDNCLPINNLTDPILSQKVEILPQPERMVLAYAQENTIVTELIERDSVLRSRDEYKLTTGDESEKVLLSSDTKVMAWYGTSLLTMGYQKIIPDRGTTRLPRDVFYLNKLNYDLYPTPPVEARKGK
jgi:hypothetical protein